ncbi:MAG: 6-phosphogluconolactonase [Bacteroidota bacterium]
MKNQKVEIFTSIENLARSSAKFIRNKTEELTEERHFNIALSGGSTPKVIYQYIADNFGERINWKKINIFWGDERCVPPQNIESNYWMANETLLKNVSIPEENLFRIRGEDDPGTEAIRYSEQIKNNVPTKNGAPQFDLVILGIGDDGHTASIFPNQMDLFFSKNICVNTVHPQTKQNRISITGQIINNASSVVFIASGESKAIIVSKIFNEGDNFVVPASLVKPVDGELIWMLDSDAAQLIK